MESVQSILSTVTMIITGGRILTPEEGKFLGRIFTECVKTRLTPKPICTPHNMRMLKDIFYNKGYEATFEHFYGLDNTAEPENIRKELQKMIVEGDWHSQHQIIDADCRYEYEKMGGGKIAAIKRYRQYYPSLSLLHAKQSVENMADSGWLLHVNRHE